MTSPLHSFISNVLLEANNTLEDVEFVVVVDSARSHSIPGVHERTCNSCREARWTASPSRQSPCLAWRDKICPKSLGEKLVEAAANSKKQSNDHSHLQSNSKKMDFPILPRRSVDTDLPCELPFAA